MITENWNFPHQEPQRDQGQKIITSILWYMKKEACLLCLHFNDNKTMRFFMHGKTSTDRNMDFKISWKVLYLGYSKSEI